MTDPMATAPAPATATATAPKAKRRRSEVENLHSGDCHGGRRNLEGTGDWNLAGWDKQKFRDRSLRPDIKRARSAAKNEKIKQGVADQKEATLENIDYGHGVGVNSPPKKKAKTGHCVDVDSPLKKKAKTGKGKKCRCGSDTHQRASNKDCPLNPLNKKENSVIWQR